MAQGWIKLHRQIKNNKIWKSKDPFDKRSAWIDLLLTANHSDHEISYNGKPLTVERGCMVTSLRKLADRWNWEKGQTESFLRTLEREGMIKKQRGDGCTIIIIINYDFYQGSETDEDDFSEDEIVDTSVDSSIDSDVDTIVDTDVDSKQLEITDFLPHSVDTNVDSGVDTIVDSGVDSGVEQTRMYINNNDLQKNVSKKNVLSKNVKSVPTRKIIPPSLEMVQEYCQQRNNKIDPQYFLDFYNARGWKYNGKTKMVDWQAAIRTWENRDKDKNKQSDNVDDFMMKKIYGENI